MLNFTEEQIFTLFGVVKERQSKLIRDLRKAEKEKSVLMQACIDEELSKIVDLIDLLYKMYEAKQKPKKP